MTTYSEHLETILNEAGREYYHVERYGASYIEVYGETTVQSELFNCQRGVPAHQVSVFVGDKNHLNIIFDVAMYPYSDNDDLDTEAILNRCDAFQTAYELARSNHLNLTFNEELYPTLQDIPIAWVSHPYGQRPRVNHDDYLTFSGIVNINRELTDKEFLDLIKILLNYRKFSFDLTNPSNIDWDFNDDERDCV